MHNLALVIAGMAFQCLVMATMNNVGFFTNMSTELNLKLFLVLSLTAAVTKIISHKLSNTGK